MLFAVEPAVVAVAVPFVDVLVPEVAVSVVIGGVVTAVEVFAVHLVVEQIVVEKVGDVLASVHMVISCLHLEDQAVLCLVDYQLVLRECDGNSHCGHSDYDLVAKQ